MDELYINDSSKSYVLVTSNAVKRHFYEFCNENECNHGKQGRGRVDPCLKLYPNAPMMLTKNKDVANGEANGSRVLMKSIIIKAGERPFVVQLDCGTRIQALYASQVKSILLVHENKAITPSEFKLESDIFQFSCKLKVGSNTEYFTMKGTQFPIISNSCTTRQKLQDCTIPRIFVNDWYYSTN